MPKVLCIINRFNLGGPTFIVAYLSRYMAPEFETRLVAGFKDDSEASSEFIVRSVGLVPEYVPGMKRSINPFQDLKAYWHIRKLIREIKPDIVHTHAAKAGALGRLAAAHEGVPVILHTFHGHVFHSYFSKWKTWIILQIERYLSSLSSCIVAISEEQRRELCEDFHVAPADKFAVVPLGFDLTRFQENYEEKRAKFRQEFQVPSDCVVISIVGRLVPIKNHRMFLQGVKHLIDNAKSPFRAFIVGDGESRAEIEQMAVELGIPFNTEKDTTFDKPLVFTSWRQDIDVINAGSDITALTSLNEGTPVSLIEAQASNKPIISTRVGGIADVVLENETALLCDRDDVPGFQQKLLQLVDDKPLRDRLGKNGYDFIFEKFHYTRMVNDMKALYERLLK